MVAGTEFGSEAGNNMLVRMALYGLKSSGTEFRSFLAETLYAMGYRPRYVDPELWLRTVVKPDNFEYYEYIICYNDNMLCISHNMRKLMKRIHEGFNLRDNKIEPGSTK